MLVLYICVRVCMYACYIIYPLVQGSPTPGPRTSLSGTGPHSRRWAAGKRTAAPHCSPSLTLPSEPPPSRSVEKLSSRKPVPGAKKVGDCCFSIYLKYSTCDINK